MKRKKAVRLVIYTSLIAVVLIFFMCKKGSNLSQGHSAPFNISKAFVPLFSGTFVHPGIINTKASLDLIRTEASDTTTARYSVYTSTLKQYTDTSQIPTSYPSIVYVKSAGSTPSELQIRENASLVYALALRFAKTTDTTWSHKAKQILNGWSYNFSAYKPTSGTSPTQAYLEAAWVAPTFVAAAEIIKYYQPNGKS